MKQKGVNINLWSTLLSIVVAATMVFFGIEVRQANLRIQEQSQIEENRRLCEQQSQLLSDGSDYLTNEIYHFVATGKVEHLENYWLEVTETRSRDRALTSLRALSLTPEEEALVESAKQASDALILGESWAMRLTCDWIGLPHEQMPPLVAAVAYTEDVEKLAPQQKEELAMQYLFGDDYTTKKQEIKQYLATFRTLLRDRKNAELEAASARTRASLAVVRGLMYALIAAFVVQAALYYKTIFRPFGHYTRALGQMGSDGFTTLTPMGARETRAFAAVFNQIVAQWQEQRERLERERDRFHVALDNTSVIVYEYDPAADLYVAFGNLEEERNAERRKNERILPRFLSEQALPLVGKPGLQFFAGLLEGKGGAQAQLQIHPTLGARSIWSHITGIPILDDSGRVTRIVGKISNIQAEKEKEFALEDARSRDGLTGLYNREAGIRRVRAYLEEKSPEEVCGLMLLDMDDFGRVNADEGQVFADAVLEDVADLLRSQTGPDDILVRLGGDEFMLFIKNCPKSRTTVLGPQIAARIRALSGMGKDAPRIGASIGMCDTTVVDEYYALYRCAESTLNYIKEHGKGQAACYLDTSNELGTMLTRIYPTKHPINEIDREQGGHEDLPTFALALLGRARNLEDALYLLLARVGKVTGMDRLAIVELDAEYLSCRVVYQWAKNPADCQIAEPRYLTRTELVDVAQCYGPDGLCERRILTGPLAAEFPSILHAAIWNYGQCVGAMSFELRKVHAWTTEERQLLSDLTRIISSFTLKARADAVSRAKTDFLSRMSHEIRTPMNAISGMTVIAKNVPGNPSKTLECLGKIDSANRYLLGLINDVLDMSRIESGKVELHPKPVSLSRLTDNLNALIRPQADGKGLIFEMKNDYTGRRLVFTDELRLNQVLVNLLGNAVKFTDKGGRVALEIVPSAETQHEVTLRFAVSDTGIGISKEAQGRIFGAFEQASGDTAYNYGGTGLGLTISSRLVHLMGGALEVDSQPGRGATFRFTLCLPFAAEEESQLSSPRPAKGGFDPTGKRLLLVEDNALNREIAGEILEMHGFAVDMAVNGQEAAARFRETEPGRYDAILMDIRMPVMDGMEAARKIRTMGKADSRTVPIIAMTANAFDEDMKQSLENGMDGHLTKPIDVDELLGTLGKLIAGRVRDPRPNSGP